MPNPLLNRRKSDQVFPPSVVEVKTPPGPIAIQSVVDAHDTWVSPAGAPWYVADVDQVTGGNPVNRWTVTLVVPLDPPKGPPNVAVAVPSPE